MPNYDPRSKAERMEAGKLGGGGSRGGGRGGSSRPDLRGPGPQGRATPHQVAGNPGAGVPGAGRGFTREGNIAPGPGARPIHGRNIPWGKTTITTQPGMPPTLSNIYGALSMAASVLGGNMFGLAAKIGRYGGSYAPDYTTERRENDPINGDRLQDRLARGDNPNAKRVLDGQQNRVVARALEEEERRRRAGYAAGGAGYRSSLLTASGRAAVSRSR